MSIADRESAGRGGGEWGNAAKGESFRRIYALWKSVHHPLRLEWVHTAYIRHEKSAAEPIEREWGYTAYIRRVCRLGVGVAAGGQ